jgi:hypothetical protein
VYPYISTDSDACKAWKLAATVCTSGTVEALSSPASAAGNWVCDGAAGGVSSDPNGFGQFCPFARVLDFVTCSSCDQSQGPALSCSAKCTPASPRITSRSCGAPEAADSSYGPAAAEAAGREVAIFPFNASQWSTPPPYKPRVSLSPPGSPAKQNLLPLLALLALPVLLAAWMAGAFGRRSAPPGAVWTEAFPKGAQGGQSEAERLQAYMQSLPPPVPPGLATEVALNLIANPPQPLRPTSLTAGVSRRSQLQELLASVQSRTGEELGEEFKQLPI